LDPLGVGLARPQHAAFGDPDGDREMREWAAAGDHARLMMLVLQDNAGCEYAYGSASGLPDTKVGIFPQALIDEARAFPP